MKNVHRFDNDSSFITEYGGSGYSEPWVSVADNVSLVKRFTMETNNSIGTYNFVKRIPVSKFNIIRTSDVNHGELNSLYLPAHIDYIYLWSVSFNYIGGGQVTKSGNTNSGGSGYICATLSNDISASNTAGYILVFDADDYYYFSNPHGIDFNSISNVTTKNDISDLAYSKRTENIKYHMEFDFADFDSTNGRIPITQNIISEVYQMNRGKSSSDDEIKFIATFQDGQTERKCFGLCHQRYIHLSDYDTSGNFINHSNPRLSKAWSIGMENDQWYLYFSSGGELA